MLDALARNLAFTYGLLAQRAGRRWITADGLSLADGGLPFAFVMNMVVPLRPVDARDIVDRADLFYGGRGYQVWSLWPVDNAAGAGLETMAPSPVMVRAPAAYRSPTTDLEVVEVKDAAGMTAFERVVKVAFEFSERVQALPPGAIIAPESPGHPDVRFWLGSVDGTAVATAWSSASDGYIGVYGVGTVATARRRGYGELMTLAALGARPDIPATLQASAMGLLIYRRMGFSEVASVERWRRPAP